MTESYISLFNRFATPNNDSGDSIGASVGVRITFAPRPFNTFYFSALIFSGIVIMIGYPLTAAANANPTPVLPLVASINVVPFFKRPDYSASKSILIPIRSFNDPPMFMNSHLARN